MVLFWLKMSKISWFFEKYRVFHKKWYFFGQIQLILGLLFFFFGQNQLIFRKIQGVPYKMVLFLLKIGHFLKKGPSISYKIAFFPFLKLMDGPQTPKRAIFRKFTGCSIRNGTFLVKNGGFSPKNVPFFMEHPVFPKI